MSITFFQSPNKKMVDNVEYKLGSQKLNGNQIYYQFYSNQKRISTSVSGLIGDIHTLLYHNLTFQGISNGNPSGIKYVIPYIHTNGTGVILQLNGGALQIQAQNSNFAGNYQVSGVLIYTKET